MGGLKKRTARHRRGVALVIVLVVVMMLGLAAYGYNHQMVNAYQLSRQHNERAQARLAAVSGIEAMLAVAELPLRVRDRQLVEGRLFRQSIEGTLGEAVVAGVGESEAWSYAIVSPVTEGGGVQGSVVGDSAWRFGLTNESGKINVGMLRRQERLFPGHAKRVLLGLPGATAEGVDEFLSAHGLVDGTGSRGGVVGGAGLVAERSRGGERSSPGAATALLAKLWTGGDWDHNERLSGLERMTSAAAEGADGARLGTALSGGGGGGDPRDSSGSAGSAWRNYVTFHSGRRNVNRDGRPRIDLNSRDLRGLHRALVSIWPRAWADYVILARQHALSPAPIAAQGSQAGAVTGSEGSGAGMPEIDFSKAAITTLVTPLDLIGTEVRIPLARRAGDAPSGPGVRERRVSSPFLGGADLVPLVDDVATDALGVVHGQIDINSAPLEVLMSIPGMAPSVAEKLVQARGSVGADGGTDGEDASRTIAWPVVRGVASLVSLRQWYPWITAGGDCYSGQSIGYRDSRSPIFRTTFVVDARSGVAKVARFQHWHGWGGGFAPESLRDEAPPLP